MLGKSEHVRVMWLACVAVAVAVAVADGDRNANVPS